MLPTITAVRLNGSARRGELPLLVLGAVIGVSALDLWSARVEGLSERFDLLAWDLPGQGYNTAVPGSSYTLEELAAGVLVVVEDVLDQRDQGGGGFFHAGEGIGAEVGSRLASLVAGRVDLVDLSLLVADEPEPVPSPRADLVAGVLAALAAGLTPDEVREAVDSALRPGP